MISKILRGLAPSGPLQLRARFTSFQLMNGFSSQYYDIGHEKKLSQILPCTINIKTMSGWQQVTLHYASEKNDYNAM